MERLKTWSKAQHGLKFSEIAAMKQKKLEARKRNEKVE
jgi:hypothetical protein